MTPAVDATRPPWTLSARWRRWFDRTLVLGLLGMSSLVLVLSGTEGLPLVLTILQIAPLWWRRSHPTATFVGHLVGGFEGAVAATAGMFLPSILITVLVTPWFARHREHPALTGAVRGVTAAVVGALAGTVPLVLDTAVPGVAPAIILVATGLAARFARLPDPALVALGAAAGVLFIG